MSMWGGKIDPVVMEVKCQQKSSKSKNPKALSHHYPLEGQAWESF